MTYPRDWRSFPPAFIALVEQSAVRRIEVPCDSDKDAKRLEGRLHAFFGALHRAAIKDKECIPLDNMARKVKVKAEGAILAASPRDTEPDNLRILQVLSGTQTQAEEVPMSAEMREMFTQRLTPGQTAL